MDTIHYVLIGVAAALVVLIVVLSVLIARAVAKRRAGEAESMGAVPDDGRLAEEVASERVVADTRAVEDGSDRVHVDMDPYTAVDDRDVKVVITDPTPERKRFKAYQQPAEPELPQSLVQQQQEAERIANSFKRPGIIQIYLDAGGKWRFRMKAAGHEAVAHSQSYATPGSCKYAIRTLLQGLDDVQVVDTVKETRYRPTVGKRMFELYLDNEGKYRFRLRAANTLIVLWSRGYANKTNARNAIGSVAHIALNHTVVEAKDETKDESKDDAKSEA